MTCPKPWRASPGDGWRDAGPDQAGLHARRDHREAQDAVRALAAQIGFEQHLADDIGLVWGGTQCAQHVEQEGALLAGSNQDGPHGAASRV
jgi:hypothetical protein